jgi:hypothetical protein
LIESSQQFSTHANKLQTYANIFSARFGARCGQSSWRSGKKKECGKPFGKTFMTVS